MMRMLVLRHFDFDDPSVFMNWADDSANEIMIRDPAIELRPEWLDGSDIIVILGGPMSVYQEAQHPWLVKEKQFLKEAIQAKKKILGICLGAQMIAEVLGAKVYANKEKEIGWHKVSCTTTQHPWLKHLPEHFTSFSWHGDTFDLPNNTVHLASSEACANQAFAYDDHVLALQFHLESTKACIETMLSKWSHEIVDSPYIQNETHIRSNMQQYSQSHQLLYGILNAIV